MNWTVLVSRTQKIAAKIYHFTNKVYIEFGVKRLLHVNQFQ